MAGGARAQEVRISPTLRPLSGSERVYLAAAQVSPPFANQLVVEGEGSLAPAALAEALRLAGEALPETRGRLRGALGWTRWVDSGEAPRVRVVDGAGWDGLGPAPFLDAPLDPWRGQVAEVLVVEGTPQRLVFRSLHAAADGVGTRTWMDLVFRALRGEALEGGALDRTDAAWVRGWPVAPRPDQALARRLFEPRGPSTWSRVRLDGHRGGPLAALLGELAREAGTPALLDVPMDLRPDLAVGPVFGNLTGLARLVVSEPGEVPALLTRARADRVGAGFPRDGERVRALPLALLRAGVRGGAEGPLSTTATVSNLGRVEPGAWSCEGFRATRFFSIPPAAPGLQLWLTLAGTGPALDLVGRARLPREALERRLAGWAAAVARGDKRGEKGGTPQGRPP
ncbi:MAG: hypothetical protein JXX28_14335 [Deltaproteobacteria bacterium]|nr:hypothetical protein [Deltaproteobacteria bacterium]